MKASEKQIWKEVPCWPDYEVSDAGEVRSYKPKRNFAPTPKVPRLLSQRTNKQGYKVVRLYNNGLSKFFTVHRLVLEAFVGPAKKGLVCRHIDGNRVNNSLKNLSWGTPKENSRDSLKHGTMQLGEKVNTAVLTEDYITKLRKMKSVNYSREARKFSVTPATIRNAYLGVTWKHV